MNMNIGQIIEDVLHGGDKMHTIPGLIQGSDQWKEFRRFRRDFLVASEAPVIMGDSPHMTRTELLNLKTTGDEKEINEWVERFIFAKGHEYEAAALPIAQARMGQELYPITGVRQIDGLMMLASFDGATMFEDDSWEHKTLNEKLRAFFDGLEAGAELPLMYVWQLEHQMLVLGTDSCVFAASLGTEDTYNEFRYESSPERREQLIEGWKLFLKDLGSHTVREPEAEIIPAAQTQLPAVSVRLDGQIAVISNLDKFGAALTDYVDQLNLEPETDQEFADLEAACKNLKKSEEALAQAEDSALAQMDDVEQMRRAVAQYREVARQARLSGEKAVKAQKQAIKIKIAYEAKAQFDEHIATLNKALGGEYMPAIPTDFNGAMKNKRTVDSLRSAANDECARARIEANRIAQRIEANLEALQTVASAHQFLFADKVQLVQQHEPEALQAIVKQRVAEHEEAERKREEQIRAEERAKAEREAEEKQRREAEEKARAEPEANQREKWADLEQARLMQNAGITSSEGMRNAAAPERPSDAEIIELVANHYGVHVATAISWVNGMDTLKAGEELGLTA